MSNDIQEQVKGIVNTLENPPQACPCCECEAESHWEPVDDYDPESPQWICPDCDSETEEMSAFNYLQDALAIEYTISSDRQYLGARVLVCFGGPNVWIDTRHNRVDGHWWQDSCNMAYRDVMGLDDCLQELFECQ